MIKLIKSVQKADNFITMSNISVRFFKVEYKIGNSTKHKYFGSYDAASDYFDTYVELIV